MGCGSIGGSLTHVKRKHLLSPFAVRQHHRLVRNDVDEPGYTVAPAMHEACRRAREEPVAPIARHAQAVGEILVYFLASQRGQTVLECDALPQLADRRSLQF